MSDRNYDFCDDPLNELVDADQRARELEDELAEAKSRVPRWIPVSERLPEDVQHVLVVVFGIVKQAIFDPKKKKLFTICGQQWERKNFAENITHWMPLPEPPETGP